MLADSSKLSTTIAQKCYFTLIQILFIAVCIKNFSFSRRYKTIFAIKYSAINLHTARIEHRNNAISLCYLVRKDLQSRNAYKWLAKSKT